MTRARAGQLPLLAHLAVFAVIVALPLAIALVLFLIDAGETARAQLEFRMRANVTALANAIDREIDRRRALLETLATSPALAAEDWPAFYAQAKAAVGERAYVVLIDDEMRQIVNTRTPFGKAPALTGDPATARKVIASGQPATSDLFMSLVTGGHVFNVALPILREGAVRHILLLALTPGDVAPILTGQALDGEWISAVWDANDVVVARSHNSAAHAGRVLPPRLREALGGEAALIETKNLDGADTVFAIAPLRQADWHVSVNAPVEKLLGPIVAAQRLGAGLVIFALFAAGLGAYFLSRIIAGPILSAASAAAAIVRGEAVDYPASPVKEANELHEALAGAQRELAERKSALAAAEGEARRHLGELQTLLEVSPAAVWISRDPQGRTIVGNAAAYAMWGLTCEAGEARAPHDLPLAQAIAGATVVTDQREVRRADGQTASLTGSAAPLKDRDGNVIGAIAIYSDISDLKRGERQQRVLINELNHRVKNMLAIVQSMAAQTARFTGDMRSFNEAFSSRLMALASAYDVLTSRAWEGAWLGEVVASAISPFKGSAGQVTVKGPAVRLTAEATVPFMLILHELATNAVKYGALASPAGRVAIDWTTRGDGALTFTWSESDGPAVAPPQRTGFGSRLIETAAGQLEGDYACSYAPSGFRCTLSLPARAAADTPLPATA